MKEISAGTWLRWFAPLALVASFGLPWLGDTGLGIAVFLPLSHAAVFAGVQMFRSWRTAADDDDDYIRDHHPRIWRWLHPMGRFSYNSFASFNFLRGRYDDGTDERLQQIKARRVRSAWHFEAAVFLIPLCWGVAVWAAYLSGTWPKQ